MNSVNLIGRITADLELKHTPQANAVCNFCIAVNESKDVVNFIDCVAWRGTAENICKFFRKGSMIGISGSLGTRTYEQNGSKRKFTEVRVTSFDFVEPKSNLEPVVPKLEEIDVSDDLPF